MAAYLETHRCNLIPISLTSLYACQHRPFSKTLVSSPSSKKLTLNFTFHKSIRDFVPIRGKNRRFCIVNGTESNEEFSSSSYSSEGIEGLAVEAKVKSQGSQFMKRVIFGLLIGLGIGGVVLAGGWIFTVALTAACLRVHESILSL